MRFIVTRYFFFMVMIIIHTVWIQEKACSYSCFLLKPPAVQSLASAPRWVVWRQPTYDLNIIHYSGECGQPKTQVSEDGSACLCASSSSLFPHSGAGGHPVPRTTRSCCPRFNARCEIPCELRSLERQGPSSSPVAGSFLHLHVFLGKRVSAVRLSGSQSTFFRVFIIFSRASRFIWRALSPTCSSARARCKQGSGTPPVCLFTRRSADSRGRRLIGQFGSSVAVE